MEEKKEQMQMMTAFANHTAPERYCKEVGKCSGSDLSKTLVWLRMVDRVPDDVQLLVARNTLQEPKACAIKMYVKKNINWPQLKMELAHEFVSADFCGAQRDKLCELAQRSRESIRAYNKTPMSYLGQG